MKSERDKERRREKHRNERRQYTATLRLDPKEMQRCKTCGGLVKLPCHKCYIDGLKGVKC